MNQAQKIFNNFILLSLLLPLALGSTHTQFFYLSVEQEPQNQQNLVQADYSRWQFISLLLNNPQAITQKESVLVGIDEGSLYTFKMQQISEAVREFLGQKIDTVTPSALSHLLTWNPTYFQSLPQFILKLSPQSSPQQLNQSFSKEDALMIMNDLRRSYGQPELIMDEDLNEKALTKVLEVVNGDPPTIFPNAEEVRIKVNSLYHFESMITRLPHYIRMMIDERWKNVGIGIHPNEFNQTTVLILFETSIQPPLNQQTLLAIEDQIIRLILTQNNHLQYSPALSQYTKNWMSGPRNSPLLSYLVARGSTPFVSILSFHMNLNENAAASVGNDGVVEEIGQANEYVGVAVGQNDGSEDGLSIFVLFK